MSPAVLFCDNNKSSKATKETHVYVGQLSNEALGQRIHEGIRVLKLNVECQNQLTEAAGSVEAAALCHFNACKKDRLEYFIWA